MSEQAAIVIEPQGEHRRRVAPCPAREPAGTAPGEEDAIGEQRDEREGE